MARLPLEGIRIIDITVVWAGPYATMTLGDMGAEVIKIESLQYVPSANRSTSGLRPSAELLRTTSAGNMYPNREAGERPWNRSASFNTNSRNKLSMTVDLTRPRGKEIFKKLVSISDVVIENNSARVMEGLGLHYEELRKVKEDIIMVSMPGLGMTGPYRDFQGFGVTLEAMSGHVSLWGYADTDPSSNNASYAADASAGANGAFAVLSALRYRNKTGRGQFIDLSQAETFIPYIGQAIMDFTMNGRLQTRTGNRHPYMAPHGCYRSKGDDRWVTIAVGSDEEWGCLCHALGDPEWTKDPKFSTALSRHSNQDEMDTLIEGWTIQRTPHEAMFALQAEGVAAGPVVFPSDAYKDPHVKERGFLMRANHKEAGTHEIPGPLWKNLNRPAGIRMAAPCLGEHNEYVYKQLLGVSDAEYQQLVEEEHIGLDFLAALEPSLR